MNNFVFFNLFNILTVCLTNNGDLEVIFKLFNWTFYFDTVSTYSCEKPNNKNVMEYNTGFTNLGFYNMKFNTEMILNIHYNDMMLKPELSYFYYSNGLHGRGAI